MSEQTPRVLDHDALYDAIVRELDSRTPRALQHSGTAHEAIEAAMTVILDLDRPAANSQRTPSSPQAGSSRTLMGWSVPDHVHWRDYYANGTLFIYCGHRQHGYARSSWFERDQAVSVGAYLRLHAHGAVVEHREDEEARAYSMDAADNGEKWTCTRCGAARWVGWRAGPAHEGYPRWAQCVRCGFVQDLPTVVDTGRRKRLSAADKIHAVYIEPDGTKLAVEVNDQIQLIELEDGVLLNRGVLDEVPVGWSEKKRLDIDLDRPAAEPEYQWSTRGAYGIGWLATDEEQARERLAVNHNQWSLHRRTVQYGVWEDIDTEGEST